jgi:hypothetical protein
MPFMPVEVAAQSYIYPPDRRAPSMREIEQYLSETRQDPAAKVSFSHNYLHDLESLWWVAVWMVFYNYFSETMPSDDHLPLEFNEKDVQEHLRQAQILFPSVLNSAKRLVGFRTLFMQACSGLPSNKQDICHLLDGLRQFLIEQYQVIEAGLPQSVDIKSSDDGIYETFKELLSFPKFSPDLVLVYIPEIYTKLRKRQRSESMKDAGVATKTRRKK